MFKTIVTILIITMTLQVSYARLDQIKEKFIPVKTFTIKNGLPSNNIQDIVQDDKGFIWFATQRGLSRYDASEFANFSTDKSNSLSIPDILVQDILPMPNNELWLAIDEIGITTFDTFNFNANSKKNSKSTLFELPSTFIFAMAKDRDNNVWLTLHGVGILKWDIKQHAFTRHLPSDENAWLTSSSTFEIIIDSQNRLWVCTTDSKVFLYDIDTGESKAFNFSINPNGESTSPIFGFTESKEGEIYAGGHSGVFKYNEKTQDFDNIINDSLLTQHYGKHVSVRRILKDSRGNLWVGTIKSLLKLSEGTLSEVIFYENGQALDSQWLTHTIFEDNEGNVWIGTEGQGVFKLTPDWDRFDIYISDDKEPIDIRSQYQFEDNIWIGHISPQIDLLEHVGNRIKLKQQYYPDFEDGSARINDIFQDSKEILWISTMTGVYKFNLLTNETTEITLASGKKLGLVNNIFRAEDRLFYFYLNEKKAIGYFDEINREVKFIENTPENHLEGSYVYNLEQGLNGSIWITTTYGVESLNPKNHIFDSVYKNVNGRIISNLYIDENKKDIWAIADGALYRLEWDGHQLIDTEDTYKNILPLVRFYQIKRLHKDRMLITTQNSGVVELNIKTLDYSVYSKDNGIPSDFIVDAITSHDNTIIISEAGIAVSNEKFIEGSALKPKLVIDSLKWGDQRIEPSTNKLLLDYNYGSLNFDMSLLTYTNSSSIEYEYNLDGMDNNWINIGNDDKFSFFKLSAGNYTLKVRGRSNYGLWSNTVEYSFVVNPPPWKSLWAYLLYGFAALALLLWFMYLYKRKILYEHEITKQQTKKDLANAASKAKSDFLARVSHEVRTPLNGVLGMSELMLDTNLDEEQMIYTDTIRASGNHLLDIINDILDLSKIESGKLELEQHSFDLLILVDEIISAFTSQATQKKLLFTCHFDHSIARNRIGDIIRIKQILFNLLSNAFKFTKQGEVSLTIKNSKTLSNAIEIHVEDTGIGINNDTVEDLFKPFIQADSAITRKFGGTGLGLAIVKQLTEKMHGTISARGKAEGGSVFIISLPLDIDINKPIKTDELHNIEIGLFIQEPRLKNSLLEYCQILDLGISENISAHTQCVFIDTFNNLNHQQKQQLSKADKLGVLVNFIGFDLDSLDHKAKSYNSQKRLITPPITFKDLRRLCKIKDVETIGRSDLAYKKAITSLNILVVEDNTINQQVCIEMLERMGHMVDIVDNAEEALTMLYRSNFDLLLTDYHLPGMDGLSLINSWGNPHAIPIIMVTADLTDAVIGECEKAGISNVVAKPFTQQALFSAIEKAVINGVSINP